MSSISGIQSSMYSTMANMSSGYKINSAADDAAGLAVSESMKSEISSSSAAQNNVADANNMLQVGEGAMQEVSSMLTRATELTNLASNGTYSDTERAIMQNELNMIIDEISRVSQSTSFNGISLLDGSASNGITFQVGTDGESYSQTSVSIEGFEDMISKLKEIDITTAEGAKDALGTLEASIEFISSERSNIGATQNRLEHTYNSLTNAELNMVAAESRIRDTDLAYESTELARKNALFQANIAMMNQEMQTSKGVLNLLS